MTTTMSERTLADLVTERPSRAGLLSRLGLDFCCHGDRELAAACDEAGLDVDDVARQLDAVATGEPEPWKDMGPTELAAHITTIHHTFLRTEMPTLVGLAAKVALVHGERHGELDRVRDLVKALWLELEPHLDKEEAVLFPAISRLASGAAEPFGSVANPIGVLLTEHDSAGEILAELRAVTAHYTVPADGCASYQALYAGLVAVETDTHIHIHKENNVLFPAITALEAAAVSA